MSDPEDDLTQQVFRLTYDGMVEDAAEFAPRGLAAGLAAPPRRFSSQMAVERMRARIGHACRSANAEEALAEYFTTRWLEQFRPLMT